MAKKRKAKRKVKKATTEGCSLAQEDSQSGVAPKAGGEKGEGKKESS